MPRTVSRDHGSAICSPMAAAFARLRRVLACSLLLAAGCQDYRWRWDYQAAENQAREQGKDLFIFYKWWMNEDSNRMHGEVVAAPEVGALLQDTINLLLEKDSSAEYAQYLGKYGVNSTPAFVIVKPDGSYRMEVGYIPKDRFIDFIRKARAGGTQSTPRSPPRAPAASPDRQP
ncbi:MAG TPA: hypothetical protein PKY77_09470 [Phycisphaerae bacterium]|nr:hypothetical protein [Phycisphaerae bacterium]HRY69838.1 hypothetical protein [Phycisphaerae bacterium]HSA25435.1 hypothetical protein [Phycisphaerae bacterium]